MNLMALIRMFTIRFRMEGAIGVVLLLLGLLGGVGMWSMLRIYDFTKTLFKCPGSKTSNCSKCKANWMRCN